VAARRRRRQVQALAAGGLVLGVGATATIAAWTDQTFGSGEFSTGTFSIEANTDGDIEGDWASTNTMQFVSDNWFPGQTEVAPVLIRTSPDTTYDGEITVESELTHADEVPNIDLGDYWEYRAAAPNLSEGTECPASLDSSSGFLFGSNDSFVAMAEEAVPRGTHTVAAGGTEVVVYCFEVRLASDAPNEVQGTNIEHTWIFNGESIVD
jgi:predicted ribosomally synthesized peptide with SipW-like signal peptide